jgi:hypothetical protein
MGTMRMLLVDLISTEAMYQAYRARATQLRARALGRRRWWWEGDPRVPLSADN